MSPTFHPRLAVGERREGTPDPIDSYCEYRHHKIKIDIQLDWYLKPLPIHPSFLDPLLGPLWSDSQYFRRNVSNMVLLVT